MKLSYDIRRLLFLDMPMLLLSLNYIMYSVFMLEDIKNILRIVAVVLFFIGTIFRDDIKTTKIELILIFLLTISLLVNGSIILNYIVITLFCVLCKYPLEIIIERAFKINLGLALICVALLLLGVINNSYYISSVGRFRYTLGFENPNAASLFFTSCIFMMSIYDYGDDILENTKLVLSTCFAIVLYYFTDCRTGFIAFLVFIAIQIIGKTLHRNNANIIKKIFYKCLIILIDCILIFHPLSSFFIDKLTFLDSLLSNRITLYRYIINNSEYLDYIIGGTIYSVDSFYYMLLFQCGLVIYVLFSLIIHYSFTLIVHNDRIEYISFVVSVLLLATMESSLIRPEILITLVFWKIIFNKLKSNKKNREINSYNIFLNQRKNKEVAINE